MLCFISATRFPRWRIIGTFKVIDSEEPEDPAFLHSSSIGVFRTVPLLFASRRYVLASSKWCDRIPLVVVI